MNDDELNIKLGHTRERKELANAISNQARSVQPQGAYTDGYLDALMWVTLELLKRELESK